MFRHKLTNVCAAIDGRKYVDVSCISKTEFIAEILQEDHEIFDLVSEIESSEGQLGPPTFETRSLTRPNIVYRQRH